MRLTKNTVFIAKLLVVDAPKAWFETAFLGKNSEQGFGGLLGSVVGLTFYFMTGIVLAIAIWQTIR